MRIGVVLLAAVIGLPGIASALPSQFVQAGLITDVAGRPFQGRHNITIRLYEEVEGGQPFFEEVHRDVRLFEGYYAVQVGSVQALNGLDFLRDNVFLGLQVDNGREAAPRTPVTKVPAAFVADVASNVTGDITPRSVSVDGDVVIDENGRWRGDPTGLVGPEGPRGPAGEQGPHGARRGPRVQRVPRAAPTRPPRSAPRSCRWTAPARVWTRTSSTG